METNLIPDQKVVAQVAAEFTAEQEAKQEAARQEVELLKRVVEQIKPALAGLVTRPRIKDMDFVAVDRAGEFQTADWAGLLVAGDATAKRVGGRDDQSGDYSGSGLRLLKDGTFRSMTYSGSWSRWQGAQDSWEAEVYEYKGYFEVLEDWDLEDILSSINVALAKQVGAREKNTKAQLERAAKVKALLSLLG